MAETDTQTQKNEFDTPWKEILRTHFKEFLAFFLPEAHDAIDWERGHEFLDKELASITREAEIGDRCVDKLVKVCQKNGIEYWVLIHVEIQGNRVTEYPVRMFIYNYRSYDISKRPVVSLAILTDDDVNWRPSEYGYELWGTRVGFRFSAVKLLDYSEAELEQTNNLFAIVTLAHMQAKKTKGQMANRYQVKSKLIRSLQQRGFSHQQAIDLLRFIDWVLHLPKELDEQLMAELIEFEETQKMPYISSFERIWEERGEKKGEAKMLTRQLQMLTRQLQRRFGELPMWVNEKLAKADSSTLEDWGLRFVDATTLDGVFADNS